MQNNSHISETALHRLNRFQNSSPIESIDTLINSIASFFNNEISATLEDQMNPKTSLMILGIHSVALTIAHAFFAKGGPDGYKLFLQHFVDGDTPDTTFSTISNEIHEWRNVIAHRWLNVSGHDFGYDYEMIEGWKKIGNVTFINPKIYLYYYMKAFGANGSIYRYENILSTEQLLDGAKNRILSKYTEPAI